MDLLIKAHAPALVVTDQPVIDRPSNKFATDASGDLNAFSTGATRYGDFGERTWWRIEKPILQNNEAVNSVTRRKIDGSASKNGHLLKD